MRFVCRSTPHRGAPLKLKHMLSPNEWRLKSILWLKELADQSAHANLKEDARRLREIAADLASDLEEDEKRLSDRPKDE